MNLIEKTPQTAIVGEIDANFTNADAQTLQNERVRLENELREAMIAGDAATIIRVQTALRELPVLITAAEIRELRQKTDAATARLAEIADETEYAEKIKAEKNKILAEKIKDAEAAGLAVERVNLVLFQLDNEAESLRESRREYRRKLQTFIDAEQGGHNGF